MWDVKSGDGAGDVRGDSAWVVLYLSNNTQFMMGANHEVAVKIWNAKMAKRDTPMRMPLA